MQRVSARKAAELLGISDTAVRKRIANGSLRAVKEKGTWRIPLEEVLRIQEGRSSERSPRPSPQSETLEPDPIKKELERVQEERDYLREEVSRLHEHLERLESTIKSLELQNERLTLLLANEQAQRLRALSGPSGWIRRLFRRKNQPDAGPFVEP